MPDVSFLFMRRVLFAVFYSLCFLCCIFYVVAFMWRFEFRAAMQTH